MDGMTMAEAEEKCGITLRQFQLLCAKVRILSAIRFGYAWAISADACGKTEKWTQ